MKEGRKEGRKAGRERWREGSKEARRKGGKDRKAGKSERLKEVRMEGRVEELSSGMPEVNCYRFANPAEAL